MASISEGFGMVLAEGASFGLPCIAFDVNTGPSDIIEDSTTGFLIEDGNLEGFATRLCFLMDDSKIREQMGIKAKQRVIEKFNKALIIRKWENLFGA